MQTRGSRLHDSAQLHPRGTLHLEWLQAVIQFYFLPTAHLLFDISFLFFFTGRHSAGESYKVGLIELHSLQFRKPTEYLSREQRLEEP